jgi:aryl-alcohol dehydrogenase-like predicted oxidoreductase
MEYRYFPKTDLKTSAIGFGTYELNHEYGPIDDDEVTEAIRVALDLGVTLIDTAPVYGFGHAEDIVGKAIEGRRKDVVLVDKCGIRGGERGKRIFDGSRESILQEIDVSLKLLRTDYIDLYLIHYSPRQTGTPMDITLNTLHEIQASGRVRYVGVSNYVLEENQQAITYPPITASQMVYNIFDRRNVPSIEFCNAHDVGIMTHGSLSYGLLAGEFHKDYVFDEADWRRRGNLRGLPLLVGDNFAKNLAVVETLKGVAASIGKTLPQMGINWVLSNPMVTVALSGCRNRQQIEENVGGVGWQISDETKRRIEDVMVDAAGREGAIF